MKNPSQAGAKRPAKPAPNQSAKKAVPRGKVSIPAPESPSQSEPEPALLFSAFNEDLMQRRDGSFFLREEFQEYFDGIKWRRWEVPEELEAAGIPLIGEDSRKRLVRVDRTLSREEVRKWFLDTAIPPELQPQFAAPPVATGGAVVLEKEDSLRTAAIPSLDRSLARPGHLPLPYWDAGNMMSDADQIDYMLPGLPAGETLHNSEALLILCAFLKEFAGVIREKIIPEAPPLMRVSWAEALIIAPAALRQRFLRGPDEQEFILPLPGLAGAMLHSPRKLLIRLSALLYEDRELIACHILTPGQLRGDIGETLVLAAEALVIAEQVVAVAYSDNFPEGWASDFVNPTPAQQIGASIIEKALKNAA